MKKVHAQLLLAASAIIPLLVSAQAPDIQWQKTIGGNKTDVLYDIKQIDDGYVLAGSSNSGAKGDKTEGCQGYDYWFLKTDQNGNVDWDNTIAGPQLDYLICVQRTSDGGYILGGESSSGDAMDKSENCMGNYDYWIVKTDQYGEVEWDQTIGGSKNDYLYALKQTIDGGYILGGYSESNATGDKSENSRGVYDYWVVKVNQYGTIMWDKTIGGKNSDYLYSLYQTSDGGYLLAGTSGSNASGEKSQNNKGTLDYWVVKINATGSVLWDKTIGGSGEDWMMSCKKSGSGYILGGYSDSNISGDKTENRKGSYDYWAVKIDRYGNVIWDKTVGGNDEDELYSIDPTNDGGYLLGGYSESGVSGDKSQACKGEYDYWVVKLDKNGGVEWDKTLGGNDEDKLRCVEQTYDGGYILGGYSESNISGDKTENNIGVYNYWLVKLSPDPQRLSQDILPAETDENILAVNVSPNPTSGTFRISIEESLPDNIALTVLNTLGQVVYSQEFSGDDFHESQIISLNNEIADGMYFVKLISGDKMVTQQILLQR